MFTASEIQLIRKNCWAQFQTLLEKIFIPVPDFTSSDEYRIYEKLDNELEEKIGGLMKSPSAVECYTKLLNLGGVAYNYSELDSELLAKVVANRNKILAAVREQVAAHDSWQEEWGNVSPGKEKFERLQYECAAIKSFDTAEIISKFENVKRSLNRSASENSFGGLERVIGLAGTLKTKSVLIAKLVDFLDELFKLFKNSKADTINDAGNAIDRCIDEARRLNNLREIKSFEPLDFEKLQEQAMRKLDDGDTTTICLRIKKVVELREKNIPPEPPAPKFSIEDLQKAVEILEQLNEIVLLKG